MIYCNPRFDNKKIISILKEKQLTQYFYFLKSGFNSQPISTLQNITNLLNDTEKFPFLAKEILKFLLAFYYKLKLWPLVAKYLKMYKEIKNVQKIQPRRKPIKNKRK